jgi:hypothetical protein
MKRQKKPFWRIYITLFIILEVTLNVFAVLNPFSISLTNADQYIEYRCIDTATQEKEGAILDHIDDRGCRVVYKDVIAATLESGKECTDNIYRKRWCSDAFGQGWSEVGCVKHPGNIKLWQNCGVYKREYYGGSEPVVNTCQFEQNDLLAGTTFTAGTTITKLSTPYPVKFFCKAHPAIFTIDAEKKSVTSTTIYDTLVNGGSFTVPAGQTLTIFYAIENNYALPTLCKSGSGLALNTAYNGTCMSTLGFTYTCSQGTYDALTGTCVVQSDTVCEKGRYDVLQDMCVYNPPIQYDCEDNTCYYSVDPNVCSCYAKEQYICPTGFVFAEPKTQEECSSYDGIWSLCPQCPADQVCPDSVCMPKCSNGQRCTYDSPLIMQCTDKNAILRDGTCVVYGDQITECLAGYELRSGACYVKGEEVIVCPTGYENVNGKCLVEGQTITICPDNTQYNRDTTKCELKVDATLVCQDGSSPTKNPLTGRVECVQTLPTFYDCPDNTVYDQSKNSCAESVQYYKPLQDIFVDVNNSKQLEQVVPQDLSKSDTVKRFIVITCISLVVSLFATLIVLRRQKR